MVEPVIHPQGGPQPQYRSAMLQFALRYLGPASVAALDQGEVLETLILEINPQWSPEDAVLGYLHARGRHDPSIAGEFHNYVVEEITGIPKSALEPAAQKMVQNAGLLQSVCADLFSNLLEMEFQGRRQMFAHLLKRIQAHSSDRIGWEKSVRSSQKTIAEKRMLEIREKTGFFATGRDDRLAYAIGRLPPRERTLMRAHLKGEPRSVTAERFGITENEVRTAIARAVKQARAMAKQTT